MENPKLNEAGRATLEKLILSSKEVHYFLRGVMSQMELKDVVPQLVGIEFVPLPEKKT